MEKESEVKEGVLNYKKRYTYADYVKWDDDTRYELIDGVPYAMSAPSRRHQKILGRLFLQLGNFLKGKSCEVYLSPFDVRLNADTCDDTVVQPDIVIICDDKKLNDAGCKGPPDMAIEILSPSTSNHDRITKFNKYLQFGVREYWIIDPETESLTVHIIKDEDYITRVYIEDSAPIHILGGFTIDLKDVFE